MMHAKSIVGERRAVGREGYFGRCNYVNASLALETVFDYISIPSTSRPITSLGVAKECLLPANNGEGEAVSVQILKREQRCELHVIQL
jgi:hypothetical protein